MSSTWEKVKVGICIPTAGLIRAAAAFSTYQVVGMLAQRKLWAEAREQGLVMFMREGSGIAANREKMVLEALALDCTHILFIDDDMSFEPQAFASLAGRRLPIVGCNYRMRFPPAEFTALHLDRSRGRMSTTAESSGLEPADYMGFGLCLIEARVFRALERPWFLPTYIEGVYTTEDLPFYWAARKGGFTAFVDQDASKLIGHIGIHDYRWHRSYEDAKQECKAGPPDGSGGPRSEVRPEGGGATERGAGIQSGG